MQYHPGIALNLCGAFNTGYIFPLFGGVGGGHVMVQIRYLSLSVAKLTGRPIFYRVHMYVLFKAIWYVLAHICVCVCVCL